MSNLEELERCLQIKNEYLKLIVDIGYDYDGYENNNEGLRAIIDELVGYAKKALKNDTKYVAYLGANGNEYNILKEIIKKY